MIILAILNDGNHPSVQSDVYSVVFSVEVFVVFLNFGAGMMDYPRMRKIASKVGL